MPKKTTTTTTTVRTTSTTSPPESAAGSNNNNSGSSSSSNVRTISTHPRLHVWVTLMVLSLVALLAVIDITDEKSSRDFQEQWSLAMAATSMCVAFLACLGHGLQGLRERFVSSAMELVCAFIVVGCWIFALPMVSTTDEGLAVDQNFRIDNANLYFACWGSFIVAMYLVASVGNERGTMMASRDVFARRWLWLIISSLVVMAASSRYYDGVCANHRTMTGSEFCSELKSGVALSVVSAIIAGIMTILLWLTPERLPVDMIGIFFCLCTLIIWGLLVAWLTFDYGPGATVGNIFFGTWISAILALDLFVSYATTRMS